MAVRNNPVLGTIKCGECGSTATVHQTQRGRGRFLYTRCPECGADQRTGKAFQRRLWTETDWRPDADPIRPPCLADEPEPNRPVPVQESGKEPEEPKHGAASGRGRGWGVALVGMGLIGAVIGLTR